jgi:hypothetical protein
MIRRTVPNLPVFTGQVDLDEVELWNHLCRVLSIPLRGSKRLQSQTALGFGEGLLKGSVAKSSGEEHHFEREPRVAFVDYVRQKGGVVIDD